MNARSTAMARGAHTHRVVLDCLSVGVIVVLCDGSIVHVNPAFAEMLRSEPSELMGSPASVGNASIESPRARSRRPTPSSCITVSVRECDCAGTDDTHDHSTAAMTRVIQVIWRS